MGGEGLLLVGLAMALGVAGVVVPVLPGLVLVYGAALTWALLSDGRGRWAVLAVATGLFVVGAVGKWVLARRSLTASGASGTTLLLGGVGAIVGLFAIPVVGAFVGLAAGVLVGEQLRLRDRRQALRSAAAVLRALGIGVLVELAAAVGIAVVWLVAVITSP